MKNWAFFDQKPGLNPLEKNTIFWTLKNAFLRSKKDSFFTVKSESIISSLILIKFK